MNLYKFLDNWPGAVNPTLFRANEFVFIQFWCVHCPNGISEAKGEIANYFSVWRSRWCFSDRTVWCQRPTNKSTFFFSKTPKICILNAISFNRFKICIFLDLGWVKADLIYALTTPTKFFLKLFSRQEVLQILQNKTQRNEEKKKSQTYRTIVPSALLQ